jgi:NAD(P)H dehydrogenase (quinone)
MSNILVTGATGPLGTAVIEDLLKKTDAANLNALVRDADKAAALKGKNIKIHVGDYNDYASLVAAFQNIDKVYMVSGNDIPNRVRQQEDIIKAAQEAGVKHIVYTSFQRKNETESSPIAFIAEGHLNTEEKLKESGLTYTILQHGLYTDLVPIFAGQELLKNKTIYLPAGDGKIAFALRTDFAEAGANVLLDESGKYDNKSIELTGNEAVSWSQIAEFISTVTGEQISYVAADDQEFVDTLTKAGVPAEYVGLFASFSKAAAEGEFDHVTAELETLLGRKPVTVAAYVQSVYGKA